MNPENQNPANSPSPNLISQPENSAPPSQPPKNGMPFEIKLAIGFGIFGFLVIVSLFIGIFIFPTRWAPPIPAITPTAMPQSPTPDLYNTEGTRSATANWKIYTNPKYGYEIKYPKTLSIEETRSVVTLKAVIEDKSEFMKITNIETEEKPFVFEDFAKALIKERFKGKGYWTGLTETTSKIKGIHAFLDDTEIMRTKDIFTYPVTYFPFSSPDINGAAIFELEDKNGEVTYSDILSTFKFLNQKTATPTEKSIESLISFETPKGWNINRNYSNYWYIAIESPVDNTKRGPNSTGVFSITITKQTIDDPDKEYLAILHPTPFPSNYQYSGHEKDYSTPIEIKINNYKALYSYGGFEGYRYFYTIFYKNDIWTISFGAGFPLTDNYYQQIINNFLNSIIFNY